MRKLRHAGFADARDAAVIGSVSPLFDYDGTEGGDTYGGTDEADTINGFGGNDTLDGGGGDDVVDGGAGSDRISGGAGDNILIGGEGSDGITSSGGADTVDGGTGNDRWMGAYAESIISLTFNDRRGTLSNGTTITGIEAVKIDTGFGDDRFVMTGQVSFALTGGSGYDTFSYVQNGYRANDATRFTIDGAGGSFDVEARYDSQGGDTARGMERVDMIGSRAGDDFIVKFDALDERQTLSLDGGDGDDVLRLTVTGKAPVSFVLGDDGVARSNVGQYTGIEDFDLTLAGNINTVVLGDGDDEVSSTGTDDTISTGGGNDLIFSRRGGASVDGGAGHDAWSTENISGRTYDQAAGTISDGTVLTGIERVTFTTNRAGPGCLVRISGTTDLTVTSYNANDVFAIDLGALTAGVTVDARGSLLTFARTSLSAAFGAAAGPVVDFVGTAFDDSVTQYQETFRFRTIDGGDGFDRLDITLQAGTQFIMGDDGVVVTPTSTYANFEKFKIAAQTGANVITTGAGDDVITVVSYSKDANELDGGGGDDTITAALGADLITGGDGDDRLTGGGGDDGLNGGEGQDLLTGGNGDDVLNGGAGDDILDGAGGDDTAGYYGATSGVVVTVKAGAQDTRGGGVDVLSSIENINGSPFDDKLTGDDFTNQLRGREGDDLLIGGGGADRLEGGTGLDRLRGGTGADTFVYLRLADVTGVRERILDFSHAEGDRIDLSAVDPAKEAGDQAFTFIGASAFSGTAGVYELRAQDQGNGVTLLQGDVDHDGLADFTVAVTTATPLVATDFVL